jgi:uncharacterized protein (DUF111 family)
MKKNRPGVALTVLCDADKVAICEDLILAETSTFGIRRYTAQRTVLQRRFETVETEYGSIRMKIGLRGDAIVQCAPEFDDCAEAAERCEKPLRVIMDAARRAWHAPRS